MILKHLYHTCVFYLSQQPQDQFKLGNPKPRALYAEVIPINFFKIDLLASYN